MHKPSFASLTVLHYFAGTSHPAIKIRSPILDVHLHPQFGLTWNLVANFGILGSTILAAVTHGTTDVQHGHTIYYDRTVTIYPGIPFLTLSKSVPRHPRSITGVEVGAVHLVHATSQIWTHGDVHSQGPCIIMLIPICQS